MCLAVQVISIIHDVNTIFLQYCNQGHFSNVLVVTKSFIDTIEFYLVAFDSPKSGLDWYHVRQAGTY